MAEILEIQGQAIWRPSGPPRVILPPGKEPYITMDELLDLDLDSFARVYYERSGRFLGMFDTEAESAMADKYRYARQYLKDGRLPWESENGNQS